MPEAIKWYLGEGDDDESEDGDDEEESYEESESDPESSDDEPPPQPVRGWRGRVGCVVEWGVRKGEFFGATYYLRVFLGEIVLMQFQHYTSILTGRRTASSSGGAAAA